MALDNSLKKKSKKRILYPAKNWDVINKANVYAFISADSSAEDLFTLIRMIRLTEQEKNIYTLLLKNFNSEKIAAELNISVIMVNKLIKNVQDKLCLQS